jgi:hypothetical protein
MIDTKLTRSGASTTDAPTRQYCAAPRRRSPEQRAQYFDGVCPACGRESVYVRDLDRFLHLDGSGNRECWCAISPRRPSTTPFIGGTRKGLAS